MIAHNQNVKDRRSPNFPCLYLIAVSAFLNVSK